MKISQLDRQIMLASKASTLDDVGGETITWTTQQTLWANRASRPSREFFEAGRTVTETLVYYTIRHVDGLDTTMRLTDGSEIFDVLEVRFSDKRNDLIQLGCKRIQ